MSADSKNRFSYLFEQYYKKKATIQEVSEFYGIVRDSATDDEIASHLENAYNEFEASVTDPFIFEQDKVFGKILNHLHGKKVTPEPVRRIILYKYLSAASVLIFLSLGLFFYINSKRSSNKELTQLTTKNTILPGRNKAILTLSNGTKIILNEDQKGILAKEGNVTIRKTEAGQINYLHANKISKNDIETAVAYNTISTPRGGQYRVVLPDGTKVWLNSSSSLKYPSFFSGKDRNVELDGEGYFEVAKDEKMPFHVKIADVNIQVLGTHFNIMGYYDEPFIQTSLLEGSVRIGKGNCTSILKPGQQALIHYNSDVIKVRTADMEDVVAWKNGYFMFDNEGLTSVMRKLSRWYDVEIVYNGKFNNVVFSGSLSRFEHVSEVLKTLQLTEMVHFKIEGRRIIVTN